MEIRILVPTGMHSETFYWNIVFRNDEVGLVSYVWTQRYHLLETIFFDIPSFISGCPGGGGVRMIKDVVELEERKGFLNIHGVLNGR